jgi:L-asparaginase/Glu-tRNA(Gln) amidotransferase subunit D
MITSKDCYLFIFIPANFHIFTFFSLMKKQIAVYFGGGTISSIPNEEGVRSAGQISLIEEFRKNHSRAENLLADLELQTPKSVYNGLSEDVSPSIQKEILVEIRTKIEEENMDGLLLTFGSDNMLNMAKFLSRSLETELAEKKIALVLTGANDDISKPETDAWRNMALAFETFQKKEAGVFICFGEQAIRATDAMMLPFDGKAMKIGSKKNQQYWKAFHKKEENREDFLIETMENLGCCVYFANSVSLTNQEEFLQKIDDKNIKIAIFVLFHSGTANVRDESRSIATLVKRLREELRVVCFGGAENGEMTTLNSYDTSVTLRKAGLVPLYDIDYYIALLKASQLTSLTKLEVIDEMLKLSELEKSKQIINQEHIKELKELYRWKN